MPIMQGARIITFEKKTPIIPASVLIASNACISGDMVIGEDSSLWFNVSARGDVNFIRIGSETNIQDNSVIHVTHQGNPTIIGNRVTVGHNAILHACKIADECLIGMGAILLDGVELSEHCFVAAGALCTPGKKFPKQSLIVGSPAKVARQLTDKEVKNIKNSADHYVKLAKKYDK